MIEIEIKGHYGQFIKGYLRRIVEEKGVIVYADDPSTEELIPLSELRLPPTENPDILALSPQLRVEALLPVTVQEDPQDNSFTEALANLQISQTTQQPTATSRLANPFACLNCPSWWPCVVTKVRDAHAVVQLRPVLPVADESAPPPPKEYTELATNLSAMTEICERKMLRPATPSDAPTLSPDVLFTHKITIPQDLLPYASDLAVHDSIQRHCGGPVSLSFEEDRLVVLSTSCETIRIVGLLEEMHLRMLRQKHGIIRYINQAKKYHDGLGGLKDGSAVGSGVDGSTWSSGDEGSFVEIFSVPSSLMGLAIGAQGANIRAARSIAGVLRIDVRESVPQRNGPAFTPSTSTASADSEVQIAQDPMGNSSFSDQPLAHFKVVAETAEAAKAARAALEFCQVCLLVPKRLIGRVLGNRTNNIVAINEKSGVRHIYLESDPRRLPKVADQESTSDGRPPYCMKVEDKHPELASPAEKDTVSGFFIVGTRDAVDKARLLITFQIECIFDLEKLEAEKLGLLRELPVRGGGGPFYGGIQHEMNHQENGGPQRGGPHSGGGGPRAPPPRGVGAGDPYHEEVQRVGNQQTMNRGAGGGGGRRAGRQPPRSSGDVSDGQRGSASPHQEGSAAVGVVIDEKKAPDESSSASTMGRRRGGVGGGSGPGPAGAQRGGGARQRNRVGPRGGNRAGSGSLAGTAVHAEQSADEHNGVAATANGADSSGPKKDMHNENSAPAQRNGKRHPVNSTTEGMPAAMHK
ncbi:Fragile X mental retardation syndrome-related protein [Echinococcus granulosus]|uniref:Fragile X mental retardation syndrome-related protein n=1 Tax=Echinococcus granulosus TaxID=6210 RepID=W6UIA1_ECHGR|nr:Fragile X mental retardation syndrome-related protein [Echinococcus granulosus]EUB61205.1 Fragile X mental retardation syndrome-related protein [Echinococcus granulosus]